MLRNALVLLPRVLHVLELDQDLRAWVGRGGGARKTAASRAARHSLHWLRRLPCSQKLPPPHSLHWVRRLPCSQMLEPPHSLHWLRCLPCSQKPEPPHSLHLLRSLPCSQMLPAPARRLPCSQMLPPPLLALPSPSRSQMHPPPHSLHALRTLPCSQMPEPPHSLHLLRSLPCSQIPFPGHSLQRYPPQPTPCTHALPVVCTPTSRGRFPSAGAMSARAVGRDARSRRRAPGDAGD